MLTFSRLFTYSFNNNFHMLGRWIINYDQSIINTKIDQANEDHCGCCNMESSLKNLNKNNTFINYNKLENNNDKDEEYYKAFII